MAKLYEINGIPVAELGFAEPPEYAITYDYDYGLETYFNDPHGLVPGDLRLWAQAEYWTALEAALLLAGVSPDDHQLYAVSRECDAAYGFVEEWQGKHFHRWKYRWEFRRASESLFLFERSSLSPKAPPIQWVKYHDRNIRRVLVMSELAPSYYDGWLEHFRSELADESPSVEELMPTVNDNPGRRERQWDVMLAVCAARKFDPLQIPDGGCAEIKSACLSRPNLFTKDGFDHAWTDGKKLNLFKMASHDKFLPKPK